MSILVCPNDPNHKKFIGRAVVTQDWLIDEEAKYLETLDACTDVYRAPTVNDNERYTCAVCGSERVAMKDE